MPDGEYGVRADATGYEPREEGVIVNSEDAEVMIVLREEGEDVVDEEGREGEEHEEVADNETDEDDEY